MAERVAPMGSPEQQCPEQQALAWTVAYRSYYWKTMMIPRKKETSNAPF